VGAESAIRLSDLRVFVDQAAERVAASKVSGGLWDAAGSVEGKRWSLLQRPVGPMPVVIPDEFVEHPAKVPWSDDEQVV
jgi:hypothetical protein